MLVERWVSLLLNNSFSRYIENRSSKQFTKIKAQEDFSHDTSSGTRILRIRLDSRTVAVEFVTRSETRKHSVEFVQLTVSVVFYQGCFLQLVCKKSSCRNVTAWVALELPDRSLVFLLVFGWKVEFLFQSKTIEFQLFHIYCLSIFF